jgi:hypothetical protein
MLRENPGCLRGEYLYLAEELKSKGLRNIHADYVAAVALGDALAETIIFGTDSGTARSEAIACGEEIYALNERQMSVDVIQRAWDFITGWLVSNRNRFSPEATPLYGKHDSSPGGKYDEYYVIPQYLDTALEDAGFNVKKTFQGLRERGLIATQKDCDGNERLKTLMRIDDKVLRGYCFQLRHNGIQPLSKENREEE